MKISTETLMHYQCGSCQQWWTIGDSQLGDNVYCPRCGIHQRSPNDGVIWETAFVELVDGWRASYKDLDCYLHEDGDFCGFKYVITAHWEPDGMGFDADNLEAAKRIVEKLIKAEANK